MKDDYQNQFKSESSNANNNREIDQKYQLNNNQNLKNIFENQQLIKINQKNSSN